LKIGNGTYDGGCSVTGSIKKALQFVEEYAQNNKVSAVVNISYGIGSIREGESEFDLLVNNIITFNDNIFICVSNGNEGPGISTTGTPAAANLAFSVGAFLPANIANECFGAALKNDKIYDFSSRGAELNKPDAIAPGAAFSTVPPFSTDDFMNGTSMAAPQAAGAASLLFSAAHQFQHSTQVTGIMLNNALKYSAIPLNEYNYLDQGNGVINIPAAFDILKSKLKKDTDCDQITYDITTMCLANGKQLARSAYWRCSGYFPSESDRQTLQLVPFLAIVWMQILAPAFIVRFL
jgi:subtilisin family serine protease